MSDLDQFDDCIVARFSRLFGDPATDNFEAFVADYRKALGGTSPTILQEASDLIVKRHKYRNWPTIGECVEAIHEIAEKHAARREAAKPAEPPPRQPTAQERARVAKLVEQCKANLNARNFQPQPGKLLAVDRIAWETRYGRREQ